MTALTTFTHFLTFWPKGCNSAPSHGNKGGGGSPALTQNRWLGTWRASPHVCIRIQPRCPPPRSPQLRGQPSVISRPASPLLIWEGWGVGWGGDLQAYTKASSKVTDCVLPRTLSLRSTRWGGLTEFPRPRNGDGHPGWEYMT